MSETCKVIPFPVSSPAFEAADLVGIYESAAADVRYCAQQLERVALSLRAGHAAAALDAVGRAMDALDRAVDALCADPPADPADPVAVDPAIEAEILEAEPVDDADEPETIDGFAVVAALKVWEGGAA